VGDGRWAERGRLIMNPGSGSAIPVANPDPWVALLINLGF